MRTAFALGIGLAGVAVLVGLGYWQLDRLAWKETVLAEIGARISAPPGPLPDAPAPETDRYRPVRVSGNFGTGAVRVLASREQAGPGYRLISPFVAGTRRVLIDRGFIGVETLVPAPPAGTVSLTGNLHWPDDRFAATPANDIAGNIWYARDIAAMAERLGTEPVLIVARDLAPEDRGVTPMPVDSAAIANNHLNYAITWFLLAAVWAAMSGYFLWSTRGTRKGAGR